MTSALHHMSFFRIQPLKIEEDYWTVYDHRSDIKVTSGNPKDVIDEAIRSGRLPGDGDTPDRSEWPDRFLDIPEERRDGLCTYVFQLNTDMDNQPRLKFVPKKPFMPLALNSISGENFVEDKQMAEHGPEGLWASFCCDLAAVRNSKLAKRIREAADHEAHSHGKLHHPAPALVVPFCLNVVDPKLGAAPWVVPSHSDDRSKNQGGRTHGGVHPPGATYLTVML